MEPLLEPWHRTLERMARSRQHRRFIDSVSVTAIGGRGGRGVASFYRDRRISRGPPDGGDGGRGGHVILVASGGDLPGALGGLRPHLLAPNGRPGRPGPRTGASGADLIVPVPSGTTIVSSLHRPGTTALGRARCGGEIPTPASLLRRLIAEMRAAGEAFDEDELREEARAMDAAFDEDAPSSGGPTAPVPEPIALNTPDDAIVVAYGGSGGLGNARYGGSHVRGKQETSTSGSPGERTSLQLRLSLIADLGLIGAPNAGKSTLLAALSRASPKIAAYPFTTLRPNLGVLRFGHRGTEQRLTIADLPGIIDGAHRNRGLGHDFLRHAERTRGVAMVVDATTRDAPRHLDLLVAELGAYRGGVLLRKAPIVIATKQDASSAPDVFAQNVHALQKRGWPVYGVSAHRGDGMAELAMGIRRIVMGEGARCHDQ